MPRSSSVTTIQRVLALRRFPAFQSLSPAELSTIAEQVRPRHYRSGSALFLPERPARSMHFVVQGRVAIKQGTEAQSVLTTHSVVGGIAALTGTTAGLSAVALSPTITLELDREAMEDVFEDSFPIFLAVLRAVARDLIEELRHRPPEADDDPVPMVGGFEKLDLPERILLLRETMDFAGMRIEALSDVASGAHVAHVSTGEVLWRPGDVAHYMLIPVTGTILAEVEGHAETVAHGRGQLVGSVDSLAGAPRWFTATVSQELTALRIDAQRMLDVVEDHMDAGLEILRALARSIQLALRGGPRLTLW